MKLENEATVTFNNFDTIESVTTSQKPFAVISKEREMTSFNPILCKQGSDAFINGNESPINVTCFIIETILTKINEMIEPMNESEMKVFLKDFSIGDQS